MQAHPIVLGDQVVGHVGELEEGMEPGGGGCLGYLAPQETLLGPLQDVGFTQEVLPGGVGAPQ